MSDEKPSGWGRVFEELKNPWDWAAFAIGGAGGVLVTVFPHGLDLGHSIPTGGLAAVGARKAAMASLRGRDLKKRAEALLEILRRDECTDLASELKGEQEKVATENHGQRGLENTIPSVGSSG